MMSGKRLTAAWLLGLILTVSGLACTSTPRADTTSGTGLAAKDACFNVRDADSFSPLHPRFVYVRLLGNEHFLLTLDALYMTLPYATGIKISSEFSRVCSGSGARITFMDSGRPAFCRIVRVDVVSSREVAEQLVKDRTTPKPKG